MGVSTKLAFKGALLEPTKTKVKGPNRKERRHEHELKSVAANDTTANGTAATPAEEEPAFQLPEDLKRLWNACEATATSFNVALKGLWPHQMRHAVDVLHGFLAKLHENAVEEALKHPQSDLIAELREEKKRRANVAAAKTQ